MLSYYYKVCVCIFVTLLSLSSSITARRHRHRGNNYPTSPVLADVVTLVVDPSGNGNFRTIQAAIDSVPFYNNKWTQININRGVYREQVNIGYNKPYIFLKGEGMDNTIIEWDAHGAINTSATFASVSDYTVAKGIKFVNSYNSPPNSNRNPIDKAAAALILGDKSTFYECGFYSVQDTLWDVQGRHYYKSCTIEGAVDFIFGNGQSIFENCIISFAGEALKGEPGYITAHGRKSGGETSGFVFKSCSVVGSGKAYLGRAWNVYARVLFYNTQMSDIIVPQGWDAWNGAGKEGQLSLSEYKCKGSGATTSRRVPWANKLSDGEVRQLTSMTFVDQEGWMNQVSPFLNSNLCPFSKP